ncbi:MAG TPA: HAMP domain-containing sensor histidine kinase [Phycisphaerales bacterium]|nr:HAMP domain-containing sensor histidine kinase [Phycisphaerales bacterium]
MLRRISLANKCLLLFGLAVVMIIVAALSVPWVRMNQLVDESELAVSRQVLSTWEAAERRPAGPQPDPGFSPVTRPGLLAGERLNVGDARVAVYNRQQAEAAAEKSPFAMRAWVRLVEQSQRGVVEVVEVERTLFQRDYRVARALRGGFTGPAGAGPGAAADAPKPEAVVVLERTSESAGRTVLINTGFMLSAGFVALGLAVLVFYLITTRIILSPVRRLRETAESVRQGNLDLRSDIHTGDEFEDLADSFNEMLQNVQTKQDQLRRLNASLDDKLTELEQRNSSLFEAARLKGEFLASVTHELRTPLNSIIGFAELLEEQINRDSEAAAADAAAPLTAAGLAKRRRYVDNIGTAGRSLLDLINGLLEMAKVEAGKMELTITPVNIKELCETHLAMMKPLADKRQVELRYEPLNIDDLAPLHTDARKLQQVLYNLTSNAIKFTADYADGKAAQMAQMDPDAAAQLSRIAVVTLRVEHLVARADEAEPASPGDSVAGVTAGGIGGGHVRVSVLDTGPGIAPADQGRIFEKFTQLDGGHQRKHAGTGLGLSIAKELTQLLQGEIQVHSEVGRGAMFSVILPMRMSEERTAEAKLEQSLRGALTGQKS